MGRLCLKGFSDKYNTLKHNKQFFIGVEAGKQSVFLLPHP